MRSVLGGVPEADLHDLMEESGELRLIRLFEDVPPGDPFPVLFVHHHNYGDGMCVAGLSSYVVRPQIILQVLTELQCVDSPVRVFRMPNLVLVDVFHNRRIVGHVVALCAWVPVLLSGLERSEGELAGKIQEKACRKKGNFKPA